MKNSLRITSIIAHIDHGKTTIVDTLIASQGYFSKSLAGDLRYLDNRKDEQERGITLKLTSIKLKNNHIFIDTPGHVDFESLILRSSILADNHLVVIDVNEGITPRFYSLIKFVDKARSIIILNKIDKCEDFEGIKSILYKVNGLVGDEVFQWEKNNIILASAIYCSGICYNTYTFSKKNTIINAFKAFKSLSNLIEKNEISEILKKYKIAFPSKKAILSTVMPLETSIFNVIDSIYESQGLQEISSLNIKDSSLFLDLGIKSKFYNLKL